MNAENEYIRIDLVRVAEGLLRRWWIVLLTTLLCGAILFFYAASFVTPMYASSVLMYVNNSSFSADAAGFSISSSEISAAKSLVDTYLVILKSRTTLNDVIRLGELDYTYEQLCGMISAGPVDDTEIFSITVTCGDPEEAGHIANTIARVLPARINDIVQGSSVRIVDEAAAPSGRASPSVAKYTVLGLVMGAALSCAVIVLLEIRDDRIRSKNDLLEYYPDVPLLSVVPDRMDGKHHGCDDMWCKLLRTNLLFLLPEAEAGSGRVIGVTSALPGEGKSASAIGLAGVLAELDKRVLLLEANLRLPSVARQTGVQCAPGLSDALADGTEPFLQPFEIKQNNGTPVRINVLAAGDTPSNPSELLNSDRMKKLVERIRGRYDYIIMDLPPILTGPDALAAAQLADGMLLVVRNGCSDRRSLSEAIRQLCLVAGNLLGFVFTGASPSSTEYGRKHGSRRRSRCETEQYKGAKGL